MITCTRCQKLYPPDPRPGRSKYPGPHLCALQEGTQGQPGAVIELPGHPMPPVHYAHQHPETRAALQAAWADGYVQGSGDQAAGRPLDRRNPYAKVDRVEQCH